MAIRVREELIRQVVKALDALHTLDDDNGLEPLLDNPVKFYAEDGRNYGFKLVYRQDTVGNFPPYFEVVL